MSYSISDFKVGDRITFWSERVFGVPVFGTVTKVGRLRLGVEAQHMGQDRSGAAVPVRWVTTIDPARVHTREDQ